MKEQVKRYIPVRYAESVIDEAGVIQGGDRKKKIPISFTLFIIETNLRYIMVDAGCDELAGFVMENMIGPVEGLKQNGISLEDISDIIITHAHDDHIAGVIHFPHATIYIQEEEYEYGKKFIPASCKVVTFTEECRVADCLIVKKIGGHSKGSCIVEFEMDEEAYIVCGDECYTSECFRWNIPTGTTVCLENSRAFLDKYGTGQYRVLMCHDYDYVEAEIEKSNSEGI